MHAYTDVHASTSACLDGCCEGILRGFVSPSHRQRRKYWPCLPKKEVLAMPAEVVLAMPAGEGSVGHACRSSVGHACQSSVGHACRSSVGPSSHGVPTMMCCKHSLVPTLLSWGHGHASSGAARTSGDPSARSEKTMSARSLQPVRHQGLGAHRSKGI